PAAEGPGELPLGRGNRAVVDAGNAQAHEAPIVELPVLVAVRAEVLAAVVMPFVGEAHGDPVAGERPELLCEAIVKLPVPLAREELDDRGTTLEELDPVPPAAVLAVREGHGVRITAVPGVFREAHLLRRRLGREGWQWWSRHLDSPHQTFMSSLNTW